MRYDSRKVCARCKRPFSSIRKCPNEAVQRKLGDYICYYCCKQCKHHTTIPMCGAIGCELWRKEDNNDSIRTTNQRRVVRVET